MPNLTPFSDATIDEHRRASRSRTTVHFGPFTVTKSMHDFTARIDGPSCGGGYFWADYLDAQVVARLMHEAFQAGTSAQLEGRPSRPFLPGTRRRER